MVIVDYEIILTKEDFENYEIDIGNCSSISLYLFNTLGERSKISTNFVYRIQGNLDNLPNNNLVLDVFFTEALKKVKEKISEIKNIEKNIKDLDEDLLNQINEIN